MINQDPAQYYAIVPCSGSFLQYNTCIVTERTLSQLVEFAKFIFGINPFKSDAS